MKKIITISVLALCLTSLSACTNRQVGTGLGAAAGAGIGYGITGSGWGAAAGAAGGALIGNQISR